MSLSFPFLVNLVNMLDKEAIRKAIKVKLLALSEDQKREKEKELEEASLQNHLANRRKGAMN